MPAFLTKKQKVQMRERRRKKKLVQPTGDDDSAVDGSQNDGDRQKDPNISEDPETTTLVSADEMLDRKRPREETLDTAPGSPSPSRPSKKRKGSLDLRTATIDGKLHIVVPNKIAVKDAKKFRKDARRQLREEGREDSDIMFVDEDELPRNSTKSSKKKHFPSIKEILQERQQLKHAQYEEEKKKEKIQQIPDEVKSQYVALDCEMVGIGSDGKKSALARVSIVDWDLNVLLDTFVKVPIRVTDFRTHVSGVEPKHIKDKNAMDVEECRNKVAEILKDKILVGHALTNDFKALMLNHPKAKIRDTAKYRPFQRYGNGKWRPRKLRDLVSENLKGNDGFQEGEHNSVEDARRTMELFQLVRPTWEKELSNKK
jgi:RNA exonuclease 4